jgi:hypothetical protein
MSRGVVIFGINNAKIEYIQLAQIAAAFVKKNMPGVPVCVITDKDSTRQFIDKKTGSYTKEFTDCFDDVVLTEHKSDFANERTYRDTRYHSVKDHFKNENRSSVYYLSPYDETLMIDCDYLVCNDSLNTVWGNVEEIMINKNAKTLMHGAMSSYEQRLNAFGIKMYWATVIYFRKGEKAKMLFDLVDHIRDNWEFYKLTYDFPGTLYRNDYAFSIALHILNGFVEDNFAVDLPNDMILTATDYDQLYGITDAKTLHLFCNDISENWRFYCTKISGINVHCMNKISILNLRKQIMETLSE